MPRHRRRSPVSGRHAVYNVLYAFSRYSTHHHQGVARCARQFGWHLNSETAYYGRIPRGWRGDGIVCLLDDDDELVQFVCHAEVPTVDIACFRNDVPLPRVCGDQAAVGRLAAEHFLERRFQHYAWFSSKLNVVVRERMRGFTDTLAKAAFRCEAWTCPKRARTRDDEWSAKRHYLVDQLRHLPKPIAVFAFHDVDAVSVLDACAEAELTVPDDVAILGVDNDPLICETVRVPLSSVNHDLERIGYEGGCLLQRLMEGEPPPDAPLVIPPRGVTTRRSTDVLAVSDAVVRRALIHMGENSRRPLEKTKIAEVAGVSVPQLERSFRACLGNSVTVEIAKVRLRRARELLTQTSLSMADVAVEAGFTSAHYFNNVFHNATGTTPLTYRRKYRAE